MIIRCVSNESDVAQRAGSSSIVRLFSSSALGCAGPARRSVSVLATTIREPLLTGTSTPLPTGSPSTVVTPSESVRSLSPSGARRSSKCQRLIWRVRAGSGWKIAPVELEEIERLRDPLQLAHPDRMAEDAQLGPELEEDLARQADAAGLGGARDTRGDVHRVAGDDGAVGQHRAPVQADAHGELVLARPGRVLARHRLLECDDRAHAGPGVGKDAEDAVTDGIDDAPFGIARRLPEEVDVELVELAADGVAEAREVRRRADDVRERHQERPLETAPELLLQLVLQPDDLGHAEAGEVDHRKGDGEEGRL